MKATHFLDSIFAALIATASFGAETLVPDLKAIPTGKGWKGSTSIISLTEKDGAPAVAAKGTGVVWLDGFGFTNGVIEFDGKGKSGPPQSNFMGIAFRVVDEKTHDVVYFRPFNFRADGAESTSFYSIRRSAKSEKFALKIRSAIPKKPCVYVGMTGLTPEERFANHKAGIKDAWVVKRYGLRVLPELYAHLNPMPFEAAAQMEQDLAGDLRRAGYTVTGGH